MSNKENIGQTLLEAGVAKFWATSILPGSDFHHYDFLDGIEDAIRELGKPPEEILSQVIKEADEGGLPPFSDFSFLEGESNWSDVALSLAGRIIGQRVYQLFPDVIEENNLRMDREASEADKRK